MLAIFIYLSKSNMSNFMLVSFLSKCRSSISMGHIKYIFKSPTYTISFKRAASQSFHNLNRLNNLKISNKGMASFQLSIYKVRNCKINSEYFRKSIKECGNGKYFHTSERRYIHPIMWTVFRPLMKLMAVITGR